MLKLCQEKYTALEVLKVIDVWSSGVIFYIKQSTLGVLTDIFKRHSISSHFLVYVNSRMIIPYRKRAKDLEEELERTVHSYQGQVCVCVCKLKQLWFVWVVYLYFDTGI